MNEVFIDMRKENERISKYFNKDLVSIEDLLSIIEELDIEIEELDKEYQTLENNLEENYRRIPVSEQVGISNRDFI